MNGEWGGLERSVISVAQTTGLGRGIIRRALYKWLLARVGHAPIEAKIGSCYAELALDNTTDVKMLLTPNSYNAAEVRFLTNHLAGC
jgi:hypothetical protein